jgi:hypothetical protein
MRKYDFINWFEDVRVGTRRLISIVPEEAFDWRAHKTSPTMEQLMRVFAGLEEQFVKGVCTNDWSTGSDPTDIRNQMFRAYAEDTDELEVLEEGPEILETTDDVIDQLDSIHQEALDIIADLSEEEFQNRRVVVPWGEEATIQRFLIGMVEREIHHRAELYEALRHYGVEVSPLILWGT